MSRTLEPAFASEVIKGTLAPILLVDLAFDSGHVRLWSGLGTLNWGGYNWTGVGDLGQVTEIRETTLAVATGLTLSLSGIPASTIAIALAEPYQGRPATLYLGAVDASGAVVASPTVLYAGRMDVMQINDGAETATISVQVENELIALETPRERRYTDQDQKIEYPLDKGLEYVASLQEKQIIWGRE